MNRSSWIASWTFSLALMKRSRSPTQARCAIIMASRGLEGCVSAQTLPSSGGTSIADDPAEHLHQHWLTPVRVTNRVTR
jgi:hypothetical protein